MTIERTGLNPNAIGSVDAETGKVMKVDLDRRILKPLCGTKTMYAYDSPEYVKDMGTPERFNAVSRDFKREEYSYVVRII